MDSEKLHQDTLLIVDDVSANVSVLFDFFNHKGFKVLVAQDGKRAIKTTNTVLPDIILLDVMMPGINGFEVCRILKSQPETRDIPIIFMTALTEVVDKVKGFELGAADYITKPIQQEEVFSRVVTHLNVRKLQQQLQKRNSELETFSRTVAHDLKNPLSAIITLTDILLESLDAHNFSEVKARKHLQFVSQSGQKMLEIINALLLLAGVSQAKVEIKPLNMTSLVEQVIQQRLVHLLKEYQAEIKLPDQWPQAVGYAPWVEEIWANYLSNALKYGGRPARLQVGGDIYNRNWVKFWVLDNGGGLTDEAQNQLFTPFKRLHQGIEGHGLGLSIVQQIVEKLGGEVGAECIINEGCLFYFTLPVATS
ncbi:MAG: hybrid sensor histidine kinase/response regulator [Beggiatoa sp. IS2]|nr:MAG: hybrid sensor histidine kinase/response regulator [Beggiatoa sp. IS2]